MVPFHGMVALACGYVVAVKQFHPDSVAFPPPAPPTLRVKVHEVVNVCEHINFERHHYSLSLSLSPLSHVCLASLHTHHHHSIHPLHLSSCWLLFLLAVLQWYGHGVDIPEVLPKEGPRSPWWHVRGLCLCHLLSRNVSAPVGHSRRFHVSFTGLNQGLSEDCENIRCWRSFHHQTDPTWDWPCRCSEKKVS